MQIRYVLVWTRWMEVEFDEAWAVALKCVKWPYDTNHRRQWRTALNTARPEFHAAYERRTSRVCDCAAALVAALEEREGVDPNEYDLIAA